MPSANIFFCEWILIKCTCLACISSLSDKIPSFFHSTSKHTVGSCRNVVGVQMESSELEEDFLRISGMSSFQLLSIFRDLWTWRTNDFQAAQTSASQPLKIHVLAFGSSEFQTFESPNSRLHKLWEALISEPLKITLQSHPRSPLSKQLKVPKTSFKQIHKTLHEVPVFLL